MTAGHPTRQGFRDELAQLRLQVELMGLRVDENLTRMGQVLQTADPGLVEPALRVLEHGQGSWVPASPNRSRRGSNRRA